QYAITFTPQVETACQVDSERIGMVPGSRNSGIHDAFYRLDRHCQASSSCYFTSPGSSSIYEVLGLKDTLRSFHLPGISYLVGLRQRGSQVNLSPSFFC